MLRWNWSSWGRRKQGVEMLEVVGGADQLPLAVSLCQTSQEKRSKSHGALDDAEYGFRAALALGIEFASIGRLQA
jgi:hypothetical protein